MCGAGPQPDCTSPLSEAQGRDIPPRDRKVSLQVAGGFCFLLCASPLSAVFMQ